MRILAERIWPNQCKRGREYGGCCYVPVNTWRIQQMDIPRAGRSAATHGLAAGWGTDSGGSVRLGDKNFYLERRSIEDP